jgi:hypothetical protein
MQFRWVGCSDFRSALRRLGYGNFTFIALYYIHHHRQAYALPRLLFVRAHTALDKLLPLAFSDTRAIVGHANAQAAIVVGIFNFHREFAGAVFIAVVQQIAEQLHQIAFVAVKQRIVFAQQLCRYGFIPVDFVQRIENFLHQRRHGQAAQNGFR